MPVRVQQGCCNLPLHGRGMCLDVYVPNTPLLHWQVGNGRCWPVHQLPAIFMHAAHPQCECLDAALDEHHQAVWDRHKLDMIHQA
jgi:hypothetical protein